MEGDAVSRKNRPSGYVGVNQRLWSAEPMSSLGGQFKKPLPQMREYPGRFRRVLFVSVPVGLGQRDMRPLRNAAADLGAQRPFAERN